MSKNVVIPIMKYMSPEAPIIGKVYTNKGVACMDLIDGAMEEGKSYHLVPSLTKHSSDLKNIFVSIDYFSLEAVR